MPGTADRSKKAAIVRLVSPTYASALSGGYHGEVMMPNPEMAMASHSDYVATLVGRGVRVTVLPSLDDRPDCCFVEDCAIIIDDVALITRLGHPSRNGEEEAVARHLATEGFELVMMDGSARLDGGDVLFYDDRFIIGRSSRSDDAGIKTLATLVEASGREVVVLDVPASTLHLVTVCTSPAPGLLIAGEGYLNQSALETLGEVIWVPKEEAYGANCLPFEDGVVIVSAGFPTVKSELEARGFKTVSIDTDSFRAADGSPTCLSLFHA